MAIATTLPKEKLERVPVLEPGVYADGLPHHEDHYLQYKLFLRPNKFGLRKRIFGFAKILRRPAAKRKVRVFPMLQRLRKAPGEKVEIVSSTIVEEVLQDIGIIDFGNRMSAKANVALWRARGDHRPLIGEFAFQFRFRRRQDLREDAIIKAQAFFRSFQYAAEDWIALTSTNTGVVYRLQRNPPSAHE